MMLQWTTVETALDSLVTRIVGLLVCAVAVWFLNKEFTPNAAAAHTSHVAMLLGVFVFGVTLAIQKAAQVSLRVLSSTALMFWPMGAGREALQRMSGKASVIPSDEKPE